MDLKKDFIIIFDNLYIKSQPIYGLKAWRWHGRRRHERRRRDGHGAASAHQTVSAAAHRLPKLFFFVQVDPGGDCAAGGTD